MAGTVKFTTVKCIKPATGMSSASNTLFAVLGGIVGGAAGGAAAVATITASGGVLFLVGAGATLGGIGGGAALSSEVAKQLDTHFSGEDDLYIKVNGEKIWPPNGKYKGVESQDSVTLNLRLPLENDCKIELWEHDTVFSDDCLGYLEIHPIHNTGQFMYAMKNDDEGSVYEVWYDVLPPDFPINPGTDLKKGYDYYASGNSYRLAFQEDGNLVVYRISDNTPVWALQKVVEGTDWRTNSRVAFEADGNLAVYHSDGKRVWETKTTSHPNAQLHLDPANGTLYITDGGETIWPK